MSRPIISIENLGKRYTLRHQGSGVRYRRLSEDLLDAIKRPFRFLTHDTSYLTHSPSPSPPTSESFWALRGVSFDVQQGEVLGIIGRNGAGKSTLLKVLGRITEPTEGRVAIRGRVASLLEVGTGFHPELTGRENVFLNGAILGMSRVEIRRKFDEIVAFAEVEKFLDTPVKHFSSGMYVRLAFAVAAHLEPEILIVDEVLAVGDADFQKKCLGKMSQVAHGGRTVLFVSHNLGAIRTLTERCIVLDAGKTAFHGSTNDAIHKYTEFMPNNKSEKAFFGSGTHTRLLRACLLDSSGKSTGSYTPGTALRFKVELETDGTKGMSLETFLVDAIGQRIALNSLYQFAGQTLPEQPGRYRATLEFDPLWLASGSYSLDLTTSIANVTWDHRVESAIEFNVAFSNPGSQSWDHKQSMGYGSFGLKCLSEPVFVSVDREYA